jgi:hypothetical protein
LLTKVADFVWNGSNNEGGAIAWAQQNPAAAINPSWGWTTSTNAAAAIAAFKIGTGASGLQVYRDGTLDTNTANVQLLLWFGGDMYREEGTSAPFSWFKYTGSGGNPWTAIAGDPRTGTTTPVVTGITLSNATVAAGAPAGTVVGNIVVSVSSGNFTGTFQPLTGTDAAKFQIVGSQLQTTQALTTGGSPYSINISTLMNGGTFTSPAISITATAAAGTVTDINLTNMTITSGQPSGTVVANIVVTVSNPVAYQLALSGAQSSHFSINSAQQLVTASSLSAETDAITITATF